MLTEVDAINKLYHDVSYFQLHPLDSDRIQKKSKEHT